MSEKILLVDDDNDTLRLVALMLQRQGYEVCVANSGQQSLEMVREEKPDMVLLDVMMPEMDGYEVARRLRADTATEEIPIIMFTAKSQVDDKVMGFEAGADDYLTKPTQPRELFAHMKAVLARSGKSRAEIPVHAAEQGRLIGVIATKGGLGVSTTALNLGIAIHDNLKKEVIVTDFRPGQGTIGLELGLSDSVGLNRLLQMRSATISVSDVEAELVSHPCGVRLLLASPEPSDGRLLSAVDNFEAIVRLLPSLSCYAVIDLGPSISPVTEKVVKYCDELVVVVEPIPNTIVQTKALLKNLTNLGVKDSRFVMILINRIRSGVHLSLSQVEEQLGRAIEVIFTPDPELAYQAASHHSPIVLHQPDSLNTQQFTRLAERITR